MDGGSLLSSAFGGAICVIRFVLIVYTFQLINLFDTICWGFILRQVIRGPVYLIVLLPLGTLVLIKAKIVLSIFGGVLFLLRSSTLLTNSIVHFHSGRYIAVLFYY